MLLMHGVAASLILGIADIIIIPKKKGVGGIPATLLADIALPNLFALFLLKNIGVVQSLFSPEAGGVVFRLKYLAAVLVFTAAVIFLRAFFSRNLVIEPDSEKKPKRAAAMNIAGAVLFFLGSAAFTATSWGRQTFGEITADQMLINLKSPTEGTSSEIIYSALDGPVLTTVFLTVIFCLFAFPRFKLISTAKGKHRTLFPCTVRRVISFAAALLMLFTGVLRGEMTFKLHKLVTAFFNSSSYIEERFADPAATPPHFPEKKRNLIHIYLESVENTFFSKELGGNLDYNLMPDLEKLSKEGYSFSHLPEGFGGPFPSTGSQWSVASMVNMGTGLPMKVPTGPNDYGTKGVFLPGATALGDILRENGYEQSLMIGAKAAFGGLDVYYTRHGGFNILDYNGVRDKGWIDDDYFVWWGFEDDKLFEFAKKELTRLSQTGRPFNFTMETADTHCPDGYLSKKAPATRESQYENCILYSQAETVKFVRWIQQQPFYDNTTIVIIGDHLTMANDYIAKYVDRDYVRTIFNLILNPAPERRSIPKERMHSRRWAAFDMFPTIISSLGAEIEGNRLGIGTDLFSGRKTLFEEEGVKEVNAELEKRSPFYETHILTDKSGAEK